MSPADPSHEPGADLGRPDPTDLDTERLILTAAVALIDEHGESGLRISDLVEASGRSVGSIYHFFGNREGVVEAVRIYRFHPRWDEDREMMLAIAEGVASMDELLDAVEQMQLQYWSPERDEVLWQRVAAIGSAHSRPSLRAALAEQQRAQTGAIEDMVRTLQRRELVPSSVDPHAAAVFVQAFTFGRILAILDGTDSLSIQEWARTSRRAVEAVLRG